MESNRRDYMPGSGNQPRHIKTDFPGVKMTRTPFEAGQLLEWLGEVLRTAKDVDVDVVVVGQPEDARSSVQITLHGLPGPFGGLEVRPSG